MTVLLVTAREFPLTQTLGLSGLKLMKVSSCQAAREVLQSGQTVHLIVTEVDLPDGNWCTVTKDIVSSGVVAEVVVWTRRKNRCLWNEVVWRGGYCALVESRNGHPLRETLQSALTQAVEDAGHIELQRSSARRPEPRPELPVERHDQQQAC